MTCAGHGEKAFGWPLRDPAGADFRRLGAGGIWLGPARFAAPHGPPPLLLVPGGYHGAWCYGGYLAAFAAHGIACGAVEPRGHGCLAKEGLDPASGLADYAEDVIAAARHCEAITGTAPILAGHSLGALVAALAASWGPASGLVLLAPSPPGNLPGARQVPAVPEGALVAPPAEAETLARFFGGVAPADLAAWQSRLCPESPTALNDRYLLRVTVDRAALAGLPALCIEAGREDQARHPMGQDKAVAEFYGARYVLMTDAPHCLMVGAAGAESAALIGAWLRDLPRR